MENSSGVEEDFPYPLSITRDAFAHNAAFDPDAFLFKNHRFISLETLLSDLSDLSKALNRDLLDLVNNEYANFIQLGQSISCGLELIENVSYDVEKFNKSVELTIQDLSGSSATAKSVLNHKKRLNLLKSKAELIILLHEQSNSFELLLGLDVDQNSPKELANKLNTLAMLYFSVVKIFSVLLKASVIDGSGSNSGPLSAKGLEDYRPLSRLHELNSTNSLPFTYREDMCTFFEKTVKTKAVSLKFEFMLYMSELNIIAKKDPKKYSDLLLLLLQISRIIGNTLHLFNKENR